LVEPAWAAAKAQIERGSNDQGCGCEDQQNRFPHHLSPTSPNKLGPIEEGGGFSGCSDSTLFTTLTMDFSMYEAGWRRLVSLNPSKISIIRTNFVTVSKLDTLKLNRIIV